MASGKFDKGKKEWVWEPVKWKKRKDNLFYSNRKIPKSFWKQKWEKPLTSDRAGVIIMKRTKRDGLKFWMCQSYHNLFGFPKGIPEENESFQETAKREFYEETGTKICLDNSLELKSYQGKRCYCFYLVTVPSDYHIKTKPTNDHEITSFGWISAKKLDKIKLNSVTKIALNTYIKTPHY